MPETEAVRQARAHKALPSPAMCRAVRVEAGLSQSVLAKDLGVDRVTIARYELGQRRPRGDILVRYVSLLRRLQGGADGT